MAGKTSLRRVRKSLTALEAAGDPVARLAAAKALREAADEAEASAVAAARRAGATWTEIGQCYGLTKQGAQQRFRALDEQRKVVKPAAPKETKDAGVTGGKAPAAT